jgi:ribosomal protein L20
MMELFRPAGIGDGCRSCLARFTCTMIARVLLIALALPAIALAAEEKTASEKVKETASDAADTAKEAAKTVAAKTRQAWNKTKAYFSENPTTYRQGARERLADLEKEIADLREAGVGSDRPYWATRLNALQEQHDYAKSQLSALPEDAKRRETKRAQLDTTISRLEQYVALAQKERADFALR